MTWRLSVLCPDCIVGSHSAELTNVSRSNQRNGDGSGGRCCAECAGESDGYGDADRAYERDDKRWDFRVSKDLTVGTYKVTVTMPGFPVVTVDNVLVTQGKHLHFAGEIADESASDHRGGCRRQRCRWTRQLRNRQPV